MADRLAPAWEPLADPGAAAVDAVARHFHLHPVIAAVVARLVQVRGSDPGAGAELDLAAVEAFLDPGLHRLDDPGGIPGMADAAAVLVPAITGGRKIAVFGDYDVDGISGTALLARFLAEAGAAVLAVVPNREDGYGLTPEAVRELKRRGADWIVTVDNGIAAVPAAREAERLGIGLVITDHHRFDPADLPPAAARVHPGLGGEPAGWAEASGSAVALALAIGLRRALREAGHYGVDEEPHLGPMIELATLGIIADIVPLVGANRVLVREGLARLRRTANPGLQALLAVSGTEPADLDAEGVAFRLGPRLNAAGRMGDARQALELLMTDDPAAAERLAKRLDLLNGQRRSVEAQILDHVEAQLAADGAGFDRDLVFAAHPDWHHGVLGIVASRLARRYHRPTVLFQIQDEVAKASARGIPELDLMALLAPLKEYALSLGGHAEAAGMTLNAADLGRARRDVEARLQEVAEPSAWQPRLRLAARMDVHDLGDWLLPQLDRLAPFGAGNPRPVFASTSFTPVSPQLFKGEHLGFRVPTGAGPVRAIGFRMRGLWPLPPGPVEVAFRPQRDSYRGDGSMQLILEDVRPAAL